MKEKKDIHHKSDKSTHKCVTCQHFEEQALILEKGPGIPDKGADEPNVFICDVCGKQFIHQNTYKRHLQSHDLPKSTKTVQERKWNCSHCGKMFGSESNLKEHVNQVHLRKPGEFMCHLCPKSYTRAGRLQAHLNTHYGIRPYSCRSCLTAFYGKASLIEHQKKCEGGVTVRFKCQLCQGYFNSQVELKNHRTRQHADVFVVSPCGKRIRWKSSLKKHTATCAKCKDIETAKDMVGKN